MEPMAWHRSYTYCVLSVGGNYPFGGERYALHVFNVVTVLLPTKSVRLHSSNLEGQPGFEGSLGGRDGSYHGTADIMDSSHVEQIWGRALT